MFYYEPFEKELYCKRKYNNCELVKRYYDGDYQIENADEEDFSAYFGE